MYKCAIILAAGEGKRMKSNIPKVLHNVCGKEMINHVIDNIRSAGIQEVNVVIGKGADKVVKGTESRKISYSTQEEQLGTGHAVMCAEDFLKDKKGSVAIFVGDGPLITENTVTKLINFHENEGCSATILTSVMSDPLKYGRIIRNTQGEAEKIVEFKDCNEYEIKVNEINSGMYCFDIEVLLNTLGKLNNNNNQGEYYLTDVIEILKTEGRKVGAIAVNVDEITAVNSKLELSMANEIMRARINEIHMDNGVIIMDPKSTYIQCDVVIGQDTLVYPGNVIEGNTIIGEGCLLYANNRITNSVIGDDVTVENSVILNSKIGECTTVGPFAYIRPETIIGSNARIGDFVEIKKSTIGNGTKVSHLTYIGDAEVGEKCNFGCGTVVVNYDGKAKNKTTIGSNVFVGCNTNLISPVEIEDDSYIAAGSTITDKVPKGSLAIARARQINKENWVYNKNK
ncbi:MAG: bifunctional UDP-N-acetylglucosamine diphosphorylase/glucosamine-1-phosphate N-acetyltransferase GlmU [Clostridium sp.]